MKIYARMDAENYTSLCSQNRGLSEQAIISVKLLTLHWLPRQPNQKMHPLLIHLGQYNMNQFVLHAKL